MITLQMIAELMALEDFDWVIEDYTDADRIVSDTHAEYSPAIESMRAHFAAKAGRPATDVSFRVFGGEVWVHTDLRSPRRRLAAEVAHWVDAHAELLDDPAAVVAASAAAFPGVPASELLEAARLAKAECDMRVLDTVPPPRH